MNAARIFALLLLVSLVVTTPAQAYLDPATGSIVLQALLAGIAGAALLVKTYWARLKGLFGRSSEKPGDDA